MSSIYMKNIVQCRIVSDHAIEFWFTCCKTHKFNFPLLVPQILENAVVCIAMKP